MSTADSHLPEHELFMQRAIALARRGWYTTRPNPRVGCVLVRDHAICGEGWHAKAGGPHAEVRALAAMRDNGYDPRGATAYVTLEPCSHHGRTPPCSEALIAAGVARVVVGARDPNPAVDGQGLQRLRAAGIDVVTGVEGAACAALNPGFNQRMQTGRPRVRIKLAMSLDGRTAAADGSSQWITGAQARADGHRLRAEAGAVMIGRGTLVADDPALTVRLPGHWLQPLRVILDSDLAVTRAARMFGLPGQTLVVTANANVARHQSLSAAGAEVWVVERGEDGLDLERILHELGGRGINDLLVEAGPTLAGALSRAGWVDEFVIYAAPLLIGAAGRGLVSLPDVHTLAEARHLLLDNVERLGEDLKITARPAAANTRR